LPNFFLDLIADTDEARRAFETHPIVFDSVANGMSLERYRILLCELYHVVENFHQRGSRRSCRSHQPPLGGIQG
jgi:hypothetical protein